MAKLADLLTYFIGELPGIILYTANMAHLSERQCHPIFGPSFLPSHADRWGRDRETFLHSWYDRYKQFQLVCQNLPLSTFSVLAYQETVPHASIQESSVY